MSVRPGSGVSARLNSGTKEKGGRRDLQIRVSARPYHLLQGPKPDLVIGKSLGFTNGDLGQGWVFCFILGERERDPETLETSIMSSSLGRI